jgi:uncharacterized paraquat-inducible protein A
MACHDCDLVQRIGEIPEGRAAQCMRCGATLVPGVALYAFMALIFVIAASLATLDSHFIWEEWERKR